MSGQLGANEGFAPSHRPLQMTSSTITYQQSQPLHRPFPGSNIPLMPHGSSHGSSSSSSGSDESGTEDDDEDDRSEDDDEEEEEEDDGKLMVDSSHTHSSAPNTYAQQPATVSATQLSFQPSLQQSVIPTDSTTSMIDYSSALSHPNSRTVDSVEYVRGTTKRSAKDISPSLSGNQLESPSSRRKQLLKNESVDQQQASRLPSRAANGPSAPNRPVTLSSVPPSAPPVSCVQVRPAPQRASTPSAEPIGSKGAKRRKITAFPQGGSQQAKAATIKSTARSGPVRAAAAPIPLSTTHPVGPYVKVEDSEMLSSSAIADLLTSEEFSDPLNGQLKAYLIASGISTESAHSVISQLCYRTANRMKGLGTVKDDTAVLTPEHQSSSASVASSQNSEIEQRSQSVETESSKLQLARIAEVSERELRLAVLQQHCFRILRNLNMCFPAWANHQGSYLWHSALLLGAVGLRQVVPYYVVFEEIWDDIRYRYIDVLRQVTEEMQKSNTKESDVSSSSATSSDAPKPQELKGGLLSSLMFQSDGLALLNCLTQLDNLRRKGDAAFVPINEFQDILAAFSAAQMLHLSQQPPVKFLTNPLLKFRTTAELSASMGRGGKRKAALAALLGTGASHSTTTTSVAAAGRGRAKKPHRSGPALQSSAEAEPTTLEGQAISASCKAKATPATTACAPKRSESLGLTSPAADRAQVQHNDDEPPGNLADANILSSSETLAKQQHYQAKSNERQIESSASFSPFDHPIEDDWEMSDDNSSSESNSPNATLCHNPGEAAVLHHSSRQVTAPVRSPPPSPSTACRQSSVGQMSQPIFTDSVGIASPHRMRPSPLLSATGSPLTPATFLPSTNEAKHFASQPIILANNGLEASPRPAVSTNHLLSSSSLHTSSPIVSKSFSATGPNVPPVALPPPASNPARSSNGGPAAANNLPPDAFELPRDPDSFRSQVKGVYYDDTSNRWCASWHERKTGKKRSRYFAVKKFGFTQAKTHAMDARLEAEESGECAPTNIN